MAFTSFREFYPYYLSEHRNATCRKLHFLGSSLVIVFFLLGIIFRDWRAFIAMPLVGYGFAWIGHFFFEKNRPATFRYPFYSLLGDWVMYGQMWAGKVPF